MILYRMRRFRVLFLLGVLFLGVGQGIVRTIVHAQSNTPLSSLIFEPQTGRIFMGNTFPVDIKVNTADTRHLNVARLTISYPVGMVDIMSCQAADGYQGIAGQPACQWANGTLHVNVQTTSAEGKSMIVPLAHLVLKGMHEGDAATLTVPQYEIVVKDATGASLLLQLSAVGQGVYQVASMSLTGALSPTPVTDAYKIPIGTTNSLTIQIGPTGAPSATPDLQPSVTPSLVPSPTTAAGTVPANTPYLRFGISLFGVENTPDITVRLRLADLVAQLTPPTTPPATGPICTTPGPGEYLFLNIPMTADSQGTYWPKAGGTVTAKGTSYLISTDGWVPLVGAPAGHPYTIAVKSEKHRSSRLANQITLSEGKSASQNINWSSAPLEPGDLPNPNAGLVQDCTVNSIDLSLITSRIGSTDASSLQIADVNYDNVINGNDVSKVVHTLSTKPDDDQ